MPQKHTIWELSENPTTTQEKNIENIEILITHAYLKIQEEPIWSLSVILKLISNFFHNKVLNKKFQTFHKSRSFHLKFQP
jgi:hypothetical protein